MNPHLGRSCACWWRKPLLTGSGAEGRPSCREPGGHEQVMFLSFTLFR
jgi:hypothetical protein